MPQLITQSKAILVHGYDVVTIVAVIGELFQFIWDSTVKPFSAYSWAAADSSLVMC